MVQNYQQTDKYISVTRVIGVQYRRVYHSDMWFSLSIVFLITEVALGQAQPKEPLKVLGKLINPEHGISSGNVTIWNETAIYVPSLYLDVPDLDSVHFRVGNGSEPSENGLPLVYKNFKYTLLSLHDENVTLVLPGNLTIDDIDWLSIWSTTSKNSLAFVELHPKIEQTHVQLSPFENLDPTLRSGPILIVDERTLFISNLHYTQKTHDAYFWAGKGKAPDENGFRIVETANLSHVVHTYTGDDIYVRLPQNTSVNDIDYVGVWSVDEKLSLGYTTLPKDLSFKRSEEYNSLKRNAMLAKCCPPGEAMGADDCRRLTRHVHPIKVYEGNLTKFNDEPLQDLQYSSYIYKPSCTHGMYDLHPDEKFYLLSGGVLLLHDGTYVTKDDYCIDISSAVGSDGTETWHYVPFVCFPEQHTFYYLNTVFVICINVSAVLLLLTSAIFILIRDARDARGFGVIAYSVTMALSFISLAVARLIHAEGDTCTILGFIYQFFIVSSFAWLGCFSFETFYKVSRYNKQQSEYKKRFYRYSAYSIGIPVIAVMISLIVHEQIPNRFGESSEYMHDSCWFRSDKKVIFYYLPIAVSVVPSIAFNLRTWRLIRHRDKKRPDYWILMADGLKNMFRSCYLLLILMLLCWGCEISSYFVDSNNGFMIAIDIIDSLQGLFVFLLLILHNPVYTVLKKHVKELCSRYKKKVEVEDNLEAENLCGNEIQLNAHA